VFCDALTLSAVADELRQKVLGGRIQRVVLLDRLAVGLEVYAHRQRQYVLISARPQ
jgi:predicted ribosome quality control (RQC) complex YloA/Tae2 family protein